MIRPSRYIVSTREQRLNSGTSDENRIASTAERRDHISFLIARAAEGEDAAFSELYALTNRKMRKTACAVYPRRAEVEDILQDAYFKIWRNAPNPIRIDPLPLAGLRGIRRWSGGGSQLIRSACANRLEISSRGSETVRNLQRIDRDPPLIEADDFEIKDGCKPDPGRVRDKKRGRNTVIGPFLAMNARTEARSIKMTASATSGQSAVKKRATTGS